MTGRAGAGARLGRALRRLAAAEVLLVAVDFDGTLAPLIDDRDAARALPESEAALRRLAAADATHVAVISGRALSDLRIRLGALAAVVTCVGSHGAEWEVSGPPGRTHGPDSAPIPAVSALADEAATALAGLAGVDVEVKPTGIAVHVRRAGAADAATAIARLERLGAGLFVPATAVRGDAASAPLEAAATPPLTVRYGDNVVEWSLTSAHKGEALLRLSNTLQATATLFIGDDRTDEDAFRALCPHGGDVGIKVGDGATAAQWRVRGPADAATWLERLAESRDGHGGLTTA